MQNISIKVPTFIFPDLKKPLKEHIKNGNFEFFKADFTTRDFNELKKEVRVALVEKLTTLGFQVKKNDSLATLSELYTIYAQKQKQQKPKKQQQLLKPEKNKHTYNYEERRDGSLLHITINNPLEGLANGDKTAYNLIHIDRPASDVFVIKPTVDVEGDIKKFKPIMGVNTPNNLLVWYNKLLEQGSATILKKLSITFYPSDQAPQDFSLSTSPTLNCVLQTILAKYKTKPMQKKVETFAKNNNLYNETPVDKKMVDRILNSSLNIRVIVMSSTNCVWYDPYIPAKHEKKKPNVIYVFAHDDHASLYIPVTDVQQIIYTNCPKKDTTNIHQPQLHYRHCTNPNEEYPEYSTRAVRVDSRIFKTYRPPSPDDENLTYALCKDENAYLYQKWKKSMDIRPLSEPYFSIFNQADNHLTTQYFQEYVINDSQGHSYDANRAFPSYIYHKLYKKYKIITDYVNLYQTDTYNLTTVLDYSGASRVSSIEYIGKAGELVKKIGWILPNQWYTHIRLFTAVTNGWVKITIDYSVIATAEDVLLPFTQDKKYNNQFIGRLIAGGLQDTYLQYYVCTNTNESKQLLYELNNDPEVEAAYYEEESGYIHASKKSTNNPTQLHQVHSCIIDYQQSTMMEMMVSALDCEIITFNTDGFFTRHKIPDFKSSTKWGEFKYEGIKNIKWYSKPDAIKPKPTVNLPTIIPNISDYVGLLSNKTKYSGPAGCGKSYVSLYKSPRVNSVFLFPTNPLVADALKNGIKNAQTLHHFAGIGTSYHEQQIYENVVLDEVSMVSHEHLSIIEDICKKYRMNLHLIGDINPDGTTFQRGVVQGTTRRKWSDYQQRAWVEDDTPIQFRRQPNQKQWDIIQSLRGKEHEEQLQILMHHCKVITQLPEKWEHIGISSMHKNICILNKQVYDIEKKPDIVPAKCTKTTKRKDGSYITINGTITDQLATDVWWGRTSSADSSKYKYEAAYFVTSDSIQGNTVTKPIIIDAKNSDMVNFLYTAVSRTTNLDNVLILNME